MRNRKKSSKGRGSASGNVIRMPRWLSTVCRSLIRSQGSLWKGSSQETSFSEWEPSCLISQLKLTPLTVMDWPQQRVQTWITVSLQLCLCYLGVEHGQHDLYTDPPETPGQCNGSSRLQRAPFLWRCGQHCQGRTRFSCSSHCCRFTPVIHHWAVSCCVRSASLNSYTHFLNVMCVKSKLKPFWHNLSEI